MFNLFSRTKKSDSGAKAILSQLGTDMHSHLLPGIDDGAKDLDTSLQLVQGMANLGYTRLITTPHILWDIYQNTPAIIHEKLNLVRAAVKEKGIDITIDAAAEYFLDEHVEQLLRNNEPLLTFSGNMVLVEFSMAFPPHGLKDILFELQMKGYQPVIAHPERYTYLERNKGFYDELKDTGALFQLNLLSLTSHYGKSVAELAHYLVKKGYYDLAGTDLHHSRHLEGLRSSSLETSLKKLLDSGKIRNASL